MHSSLTQTQEAKISRSSKRASRPQVRKGFCMQLTPTGETALFASESECPVSFPDFECYENTDGFLQLTRGSDVAQNTSIVPQDVSTLAASSDKNADKPKKRITAPLRRLMTNLSSEIENSPKGGMEIRQQPTPLPSVRTNSNPRSTRAA